MYALSTAFVISCGGGSDGSDPDPSPSPSPTPTPTPSPAAEWELVWQDEFDGDEIDSEKWGFEVNCWGGGNEEQQCYTDRPENAFVADGVLNIVAIKEDFTGPSLNQEDPGYPGADKTLPYTSARMRTRNLAEWSYGRFEARIKFPEGQGTWAAFWMLPANSPYGTWASNGEIDIVEVVNLKSTVNAGDAANSELVEEGDAESRVHGTLHYGRGWPDNKNSGGEYLIPGVNPADDFHDYAVEWEDGEIRWYVDGVHYATQTEDGWYSQYTVDGILVDAPVGAPFDDAAPFHLLLNLAVGGGWPVNVNELGITEEDIWPQTMQVEWVRVYECTASPSTGAGCATVGDDAVLVEGNERPSLINTTAPSPVANIFNDTLTLWATDTSSGGGSSVTVEVIEDPVDPEGHGNVVQFTYTGPENVAFFQSESEMDFSSYAGGTLEFDMYVVSNSDDPTAVWTMKTETYQVGSTGDTPVTESVEGLAPVVGEWQHFTFNIDDLVNRSGSNLNLARLQTPLVIFPTWGGSNGAVVRIDNVVLTEAP